MAQDGKSVLSNTMSCLNGQLMGSVENARLARPLSYTLGSIQEHRLSVEGVATINRWMNICQQYHPICTWSANSGALYPTYLLDLGGGAREPEVRLVFNGGQESAYIALSYCWGDAKPLKTTKATLDERQQGIPWTSLPQTFRDVLLLARASGFSKVWIDALCMVQDDKTAMVEELAKMRDIFQCACLIVIAADASTPNDGILGHESARRRWLWSKAVVRYWELGQEVVRFRNRVHTNDRGVDACKGPRR